MFKINDYVVYNTTGVCKIIDIRKEKGISNNDMDYYVLEPAYDKNLTIKTPVNNPKVLMRNIITKDEILELIAAMPNNESPWISDDRERNETFKAALKSLDSEKWIKLIRTIYIAKQKKTELGKKLSKADEEIMKIAEKNLNEEFALALNISPDEVVPYILERIPM